MRHTKITISTARAITFGRDRLGRMIAEADPGDYMVSLEEWKAAKTVLQIRGFHGPILDGMCEVTGYHKHEAKFILKDMFGQKRVVKNKFTGEVKTELVSLSQYTKDQMTNLIKQSLMWMETELGIVIDMKEKKRYHLDELTGTLTEF